MAALLQPLDSTHSSGVSRSDRPLSIKVLGIMSLAIGALGTLGCGMFALKEGLTVYSKGGLPVPTGAIIPYPRALLLTSIAFSAVDLMTSAAFAYGAIGALRLLPWARRMMVTLSVIILVLASLKCILGLGVFREDLVDVRRRERAQYTAEQLKNVPPDADQQLESMSRTGPLAMLVMQAGVPLLVLLFWTRKPVRDAFARQPAAA